MHRRQGPIDRPVEWPENRLYLKGILNGAAGELSPYIGEESKELKVTKAE